MLTRRTSSFALAACVIPLFLSISCESHKQVRTSENSSVESGASRTEFSPEFDWLSPMESPITEEIAIQRAERFIIENGYTVLLPSSDESRFRDESVFPGSFESRHGTLESNAYTIRRAADAGGEGWLVIFRYNRSHLVKLMPDGSANRIYATAVRRCRYLSKQESQRCLCCSHG